MSDEMAQSQLDPTPFDRVSFRGPLTVSRVLACYCDEMFAPYTDANIRYLLRQLAWPEITIDDKNEATRAYNRELARVYRYRIDRTIREDCRGLEQPIDLNVEARILAEWENEGILHINRGVDPNVAAEFQENEEDAHSDEDDGDESGDDDIDNPEVF